jgi:hypothetical protein
MIGTADLSQLPGRANPIFLEGKLPPLTMEQARQLDLKDGEIVQALVRSRGLADLELVIRGRPLNLAATPTSSGWLTGQQIALQAQVAPSGAVFLQPMADVLRTAAEAAPTFFSRIGQLLFRPPGVSQLAQVFQPGVLNALLQAASRPDLQAQWRAMQLSMAQLNPQALGRAMAAAMGPEVWMARGQLPPAEDPKQLLRKLMAALALGESAEPAEGEGVEKLALLSRALEDIEASQVQAVQAQAQRELLFSFVLPFADSEPVEFQLRRAPRQGGDEPPPLVVNVHSRNQALGELWLRTQLHAQDRVDLTMWALNEPVVTQARERSGELGQQLAEAGLAMQSFQVIHGPRPEVQGDWVPSGRGLVVDMSA